MSNNNKNSSSWLTNNNKRHHFVRIDELFNRYEPPQIPTLFRPFQYPQQQQQNSGRLNDDPNDVHNSQSFFRVELFHSSTINFKNRNGFNLIINAFHRKNGIVNDMFHTQVAYLRIFVSIEEENGFFTPIPSMLMP